MLIAERIQKVTDALGAVSVLTEQKFLAIGDSVERAVAILSRMAVTFETLLSQMRSNVVIQAKHDLALAAGEAGRLSDATGSEVPTLERMGHTTEAIKSRITATWICWRSMRGSFRPVWAKRESTSWGSRSKSAAPESWRRTLSNGLATS
jgi:hypothetical protein